MDKTEHMVQTEKIFSIRIVMSGDYKKYIFLGYTAEKLVFKVTTLREVFPKCMPLKPRRLFSQICKAYLKAQTSVK